MKLAFAPSRGEFESFLDLQLRLVGMSASDVAAELDPAYERIARIFSRTSLKYYSQDGAPLLRVAHNAQYTIFLYELSRLVFKAGRREHADRIYALLRMVSSVDLYYEVDLPDLWGCDHPLGSVIGRGQFSPQATIFFSQNCNIGNNRGIYPRVHGNLNMKPNSGLLGDCVIEGNVILSNGTVAMDAGRLSDCIVFGRSPDLIIKPLAAGKFEDVYVLRVG